MPPGRGGEPQNPTEAGVELVIAGEAEALGDVLDPLSWIGEQTGGFSNTGADLEILGRHTRRTAEQITQTTWADSGLACKFADAESTRWIGRDTREAAGNARIRFGLDRQPASLDDQVGEQAA